MAKGNSVLPKALSEASDKARKRDNDPLGMLLDAELQKKVAEASAKADELGLYLGFKKRTSKIKFAQVIQANVLHLYQTKYLTLEEFAFFHRVTPHVIYGANYLVDYVESNNPKALNQKMLADMFEKKPSYISKIVKQLVTKGILAKGYSGEDKPSSKNYLIFVNPAFILSGDKTRIQPHLYGLFGEITTTKKVLKDLPVKIF